MMTTIWERFWFGPAALLPLSFFRINLGLLILCTFLCSAPNWERFYAYDGICSLQITEVSRAAPEDPQSCFYWTEGIVPVRAWWVVGLLAATSFTLGYRTRLCTVTLFVLQCSMIHRSRLLTNGDDLMFRMLLFHSCFAPLGHRLSLDAWLRRKRQLPDLPAPWIWPQRMLQINVALIYAISLPFKFAQDGAWASGQAIYWTMASDMWYRGWFPQLAYSWGPWFSYCATYGTILIEGAFPFLVWFGRTRMPAVWAATALHLGIALFVPHVLFFTLAMVAGFWVYYPESMLESLVARLKRVDR
ncbi:HTTM domain-containing protein [bacterium]|nr:HTTM domain-containing protein [bacterium]